MMKSSMITDVCFEEGIGSKKREAFNKRKILCKFRIYSTDPDTLAASHFAKLIRRTDAVAQERTPNLLSFLYVYQHSICLKVITSDA